ncbi:hypothetical protein L6164_000119 [Bauhinia variegata]|uniref:Uncharacterized protein n=1 Tax=Bauhinia variegata TaxID=167791 RepID=A0ACB9Q5I8_BAUVA|nr:hypothetical protein L6164_000119 [Bauhinia variegata]
MASSYFSPSPKTLALSGFAMCTASDVESEIRKQINNGRLVFMWKQQHNQRNFKFNQLGGLDKAIKRNTTLATEFINALISFAIGMGNRVTYQLLSNKKIISLIKAPCFW